MKKWILLSALILYGCEKASSVDFRTVSVSWSAVTELEDGSPLPQEYVYYIVYELTAQATVCTTTDLSCDWQTESGKCYEFGATATDTRSNLTSILSDTVSWCNTGPPSKSPPKKVKNVTAN